jgi:pentatricopeptide repeat protein
MVRSGTLPDDVAFATVLQASACMSAWAIGTSMHASVVKTGFLDSDGIANSLITMYSKCGCLDDAHRAFVGAKDHLHVMPWTAMITALQQHGHGMQAIDVFENMLENGIPPDHITFVSVLSSCSHSGLVEQGRKYFDSMTQVHKITPWNQHYACMVDMFGRAGLLTEAKRFIHQMRPKPDASVLGALLSACMNCRDLEMGKEVAKKLFVIEPGNTGNYVLLANIYASHGRLEEAKEVRRWMMFQELRKEKGCSLINN